MPRVLARVSSNVVHARASMTRCGAAMSTAVAMTQTRTRKGAIRASTPTCQWAWMNGREGPNDSIAWSELHTSIVNTDTETRLARAEMIAIPRALRSLLDRDTSHAANTGIAMGAWSSSVFDIVYASLPAAACAACEGRRSTFGSSFSIPPRLSVQRRSASSRRCDNASNGNTTKRSIRASAKCRWSDA